MYSQLSPAIAFLLAMNSTTFAACPDTLGDSAIIKVPQGLNVRIMYHRRKTEPIYLEICESSEGDEKLLFGGTVNVSTWEVALSVTAKPERSFLKTYSDRISGTTHKPWDGMRWVPTDFGILQNWYGETESGYDPNTVIEVCLYLDINECPKH